MITVPGRPALVRPLAALSLGCLVLAGCSGTASTDASSPPPTPAATWSDGGHEAWTIDLGHAPTAGDGRSTVWRAGSPTDNHPVLVEDTPEQVIIGTGTQISAYDPATGESRWTATVEPVGENPACAGTVVKDRLWCANGVIDTTSGDVVLTPEAVGERTSFLTAKSIVIRSDYDEASDTVTYSGLDPVSGSELWSVDGAQGAGWTIESDIVVVDGQVIDGTTGTTLATLDVPDLGGQSFFVGLSPLPDGTFVLNYTGITTEPSVRFSGVDAMAVLDASGQPLLPPTVVNGYEDLSTCAGSDAALAVINDIEGMTCIEGPDGQAVPRAPEDSSSSEVLDQVGLYDLLAYDEAGDVAVYFSYFPSQEDRKAAIVARRGYSTVDLSTWGYEDHKAFQELPEAWRSQDMQLATTDPETVPTGTEILRLSATTTPDYDVDHFYTMTYSETTMTVARWEPGAQS